jgi:tellurite resistance protein TerC
LWPWIAFNAAILAILAIDLGLFDRKAHVVSPKEAGLWTVVWVSLALAFAGAIFYFKGHEAGTQFITGYLIEYSLSVDNIFVFVLLFSYFKVKDEHQHRILFWGILGALIMRGAMIAAGSVLLNRFEWITYLFGAFLVYTGARMAFQDEAEVHPDTNPVLRFIRRVIPISKDYHGQQFFVQSSENGVVRRMATPLFVVLVLIETTDLIFAVDSIPAVFSVTRDPFIVYTSNVCAILGLRSLYFLLAGAINKFHHLHYGLAAVLMFVGVKMLIAAVYHIPTLVSLGVIFLALGTSVVTSLLFPSRDIEIRE